MAQIVLINIPPDDAKKPYDKAFRFSRVMNFGLLSIATYLHSHGVSVRLLDLFTYDVVDPWKDVLCEIKKESPVAIGLSCISGFSYPPFRHASKLIKSLFPDIKILAGGKDHVGLIARVVLSECEEIDILVKDEGEIVTLEILKALMNQHSLSKIPNIAYRNVRGSIVETHSDANSILDEIPSLDYTLYPDYISFPPSIEVSRGCPYRGSFCGSAKTRIRKKPVVEVIKDVKTINKLYKTSGPTIYFETPMFIFTNAEIDELVNIRRREELEFTWRTETRVEYLDTQSIDKLAMAGLRVVDLGLESASPEILLRMNKTSNPDSYLNAATKVLKEAFENGLIIKINLLFYIGENRKTLSETITFLDSNRDYIRSISAYPFILYPSVRDNPDIQTQLSQHGGSFDTSREWEERHLIAVNPSVEFSYAELQHIGILFGKSYQSINTFFEQKRFGYLSPGISFSEFKAQSEHFGIEKFPFFIDKKQSETAKSELMRITSRKV